VDLIRDGQGSIVLTCESEVSATTRIQPAKPGVFCLPYASRGSRRPRRRKRSGPRAGVGSQAVVLVSAPPSSQVVV